MAEKKKPGSGETKGGKPKLHRKEVKKKEPEASEEYQRFEDAVRTILSVPKEDVDREIEKRKQRKAK